MGVWLAKGMGHNPALFGGVDGRRFPAGKHMDDEQLPGLVVSDAGHEDRVTGAVPARSRVNTDIAAVGTAVQRLAAHEGTVAEPIHHIVVLAAFAVPINGFYPPRKWGKALGEKGERGFWRFKM